MVSLPVNVSIKMLARVGAKKELMTAPSIWFQILPLKRNGVCDAAKKEKLLKFVFINI